MRYVAIFRPSPNAGPPSEATIEAMMHFINEAVEAGVLIATEGFGPSTKADMRVRSSNGKVTVTDGPFTESKEIIGGFALMETKSREEMIEWTRRFLDIGGDGEAEVRQLVERSPIEQSKQFLKHKR